MNILHVQVLTESEQHCIIRDILNQLDVPMMEYTKEYGGRIRTHYMLKNLVFELGICLHDKYISNSWFILITERET